jgi:hypothetical protein
MDVVAGVLEQLGEPVGQLSGGKRNGYAAL